MARARNIKPAFFTNDLVAEMTPWSRLLFIGLWTLADREGRVHYRPKKIKMELFPGDTIDVEPLILELVSHGFVSTYISDGIDVLEVVNFVKHQNPHPKEKASDLPARKPETTGNPEQVDNDPDVNDTSREITGHDPEINKPSGLNPSSLIPDSPLLNPSLLSPPADPADPDDPDDPNDIPGNNVLSHRQQALFDRWYEMYPKKRGRLDAEKAWDKIKPKPTEDLVDVMVAKVREWTGSDEWTRNGGQYVPNPSTWLNQGRWTDGAPSAPGSNVKQFQSRYETPADRTAAAFDTFFAELDGVPPDPYADHEVIDVKVSGS
jgi:hypothetical protein